MWGEIGDIAKMISYDVAIGLLWVMGSIGGRIAKHGYKMFLNRK